MNSFTDQINSWVHCIQEKIKPLATDNFKFIEHQRNIFYFSKFSIEIDEFKQILTIIRLIKESTFKNLINKIKYTINSALNFAENNLSDKDKGMTLFSVCYLHYYTCFGYETTNSFDCYFNEEFYALCGRFRFTITNNDLFKAFSFEFFSEIQNQIKTINYAKIKTFYDYYNASAIEEQKTHFLTSNNPLELLQNYLHNQKNAMVKKSCFIKSKLLTHLVATKERIVDMVLEKRAKRFINDANMQKEFNAIVEKIHSIPKETFTEYKKHPIIKLNKGNNKMINDDNMMVDTDYRSSTSTIDNNSNNNSNSNNTEYSKRVISELIKCEIDDNTRTKINEISQKVDELFLDVLLNQNEKNINMINPFVCYIIEINSEIIKLIPEYSNLRDDLSLRFIVPAKNLYNKFFEIYFSIYDLKYTGIETVCSILTKRGLQLKLATSVYSFFKGLTNEMFKEKNNVMEKMDSVLDNFFNEQFKVWESTIKEKGQELTHFCLL